MARSRSRPISQAHVSLIFNLFLIEMRNVPLADRPPLEVVRGWDNDIGREINRLCETMPCFQNYFYKVMRGDKPFAFAYAGAILSNDQEIIDRVPNNGPLVAALATSNARRSWTLCATLLISALLVVAYVSGQRLGSGAGLSDPTQSVPSETRSTPMPLPIETEVDGAGLSDLSSKIQSVPMPYSQTFTFAAFPSENIIFCVASRHYTSYLLVSYALNM